jgi:hypothetical protein
MPAGTDSSHALRRGILAIVVVAAAAWGAGAAAVGGGFWSAVGPGRIAVKRSGVRPFEVLGNLRLDFSGKPSDLSGTAVVTAYDAIGQQVLAEFPCTWTTGKGAAFQLELANDGFGEFLEGRIAAATGKAASVSLTSARGKGSLVKGGVDLRIALAAAGECSLDGGPPLKFQVKMRCR